MCPAPRTRVGARLAGTPPRRTLAATPPDAKAAPGDSGRRHSLASADERTPLVDRQLLHHAVCEVRLSILRVRQEAHEQVLAGLQVQVGDVLDARRDRADAALERSRRRALHPILGPREEILARLA